MACWALGNREEGTQDTWKEGPTCLMYLQISHWTSHWSLSLELLAGSTSDIVRAHTIWSTLAT